MRDLRRDPVRAESRHDPACGIAAAIIGSAVVTAGVGAYSANKAADKQVGAATQASGVQRDMFNQVRSDLAPYNAAGQSVLPAYTNLLTGNPAQVQAQLEALPGYQFTRTQGLKAVQNGASARGLGVSGAAFKGAANFATGLADATYGNQVNRLLDAARLGESAAAQTGSFGTQTAQSIGNNLLGAGNAAAGGAIGVGNAISGGANGLVNGLLLQQILSGQGGSGGMYGGGQSPNGMAGRT